MTRFDWRALARSTSGNVLPITAGAIIVLAGLIGGAVDISRAYLVKNQLQNACDSGVLAGRRAVTTNGYDNQARQQANTYFGANFRMDGSNVSDTHFITAADAPGNEVEGTATTRMSTAMMNLFGIDSLELEAVCTASMSVGNSDVMMVLDVTGSMGNPVPGSSQSKMKALQVAMKNFYTTVAAAKAGSNARVRFGFVPYSSSVNVGRLIYDLNPNYLRDSYAVQSRVFVGTKTIQREVCDDSGACSNVNVQVPDWRYRQVTDYDYAAYKRFSSVQTLTDEKDDLPVSRTSVWQGCIEERATNPANGFSYSRLTGMSPSSAQDLDLDSAPTSDDSTKWASMWPEVAFRRSSPSEASSGAAAAGPCPAAARLLSEMNKTQFDSYANSLKATGSTYHDIGMIWGGRLISPQGIFAANVNSSPENGGSVSRHVIFMTDGKMEPSTTTQSSYGIEAVDRRVTGNGSSSQQVLRHNSRYLAVCEAIKAKGIRVWAVAFGLDLTKAADKEALANLTTCADSGSVFSADNAAQLNAAFQDIAKEVGELRIRR